MNSLCCRAYQEPFDFLRAKRFLVNLDRLGRIPTQIMCGVNRCKNPSGIGFVIFLLMLSYH
jgi:hypothetical protein